MSQKSPKSNKKQALIEAYISKLGNISEACKEVGISRKTYYRWLKQNKFNQMLNDATEHHNDLIYQRILKKALEEDKDMMKFWAKTQMKHRGFYEKQETEYSGEVTQNIDKIEVEVIRTTKNETETKDNKSL